MEPIRPTIQLAAVAVENGIELGAFEQKIAFVEAEADPTALALNHYTREAWVNACAPQIAVSRFSAWLRPYSVVPKISKAGKPYNVARLAGYNAATFDMPRLRAMFGTQFLPDEYLVRDVLQRVLYWFDEHPNEPTPGNFKLSTIAAYFGICVDGAHDALADARMAAKIAERCARAD